VTADNPTEAIQVLLVEDEPANRALIRAMLSRIPMPADRRLELHEAATLAEARAILAGVSPSLVILDVRLPDGNGLDLATELRESRGGDRPAVIVASASVLPAERDAAIERGADAFLAKPFGLGEFSEVVRRFVG
jgi:two-component system OmpR family response regulator/two-component system phosphate regulon response regulator OmpR